VELKLTFKEGGAFDYHNIFEQVKERLYNAVQMARDQGRNVGSVGGVVDVAGLGEVHMEQLPAYEAPPGPESDHDQITVADGLSPHRAGAQTQPHDPSPDEPPPGYEEAQAQAVGISFDQRLREEAERGRSDDDDEDERQRR
jgi:hypothetical protein